jgi:hypothetical protein
MYNSTDVISILANGMNNSSLSTAPLLQDKWLRCPLHWACTHPNGRNTWWNNETRNNWSEKMILSKILCQARKESVNTGMVDSVRTLLTSYPEATIIQDSDGKTPLDLAIEHNADPNIIRLLANVEQTVREERQCMKCNKFWGSSNNGETLSLSASECDSFPEGFSGEVRISPYRNDVNAGKSRRFKYTAFEC